MNRVSMTFNTILFLVVLSLLTSGEAAAQKKKSPAKTEPAVEQATPPPPPMQTKLGSALRDVLTKYKGEKTNLGMLTKVEGDYFVVEDDGVSTIHPMTAIISIKLLKVEEGDEDSPKIEIVLMR